MNIKEEYPKLYEIVDRVFCNETGISIFDVDPDITMESILEEEGIDREDWEPLLDDIAINISKHLLQIFKKDIGLGIDEFYYETTLTELMEYIISKLPEEFKESKSFLDI